MPLLTLKFIKVKKYLLASLLIFCSLLLASAQDVVVKHDGSHLKVKVNYLTESAVAFTIPGETRPIKMGRAEVEKIIYQSGRTEAVSQKVIINGRQDWNKIIVTSNPLSIVGLTKKGEIKVKSGKQAHGVANFESKDIEKIKKQAADMGAHVVVVNGYDGRSEPETSQESKIEIINAYGY